MAKCQCDSCQRRGVWRETKRLKRPGLLKLIEELRSAYIHAEQDREVNQAIIDGSWPDADQHIAAARAKTKEVARG